MDVLKPDEKSFADRMAALCYKHYSQLPKKGKPQEGKEWTLLAAVVQQTEQGSIFTFCVCVCVCVDAYVCL